MQDLTTQPLSEATWPDFEALAVAHNGVWGGCWCIAFHADGNAYKTSDAARAAKHDKVRHKQAHAALVYDEAGACVGWVQFGSPQEVPRIKNRANYDKSLERLPDWRITCLFVGKGARKKGVARAGVIGALEQIASLGGGLVEAYPEETEGRKVSGAFLWNGTTGMFESLGFGRDRKIGKHNWVMRREVAPAADI